MQIQNSQVDLSGKDESIVIKGYDSHRLYQGDPAIAFFFFFFCCCLISGVHKSLAVIKICCMHYSFYHSPTPFACEITMCSKGGLQSLKLHVTPFQRAIGIYYGICDDGLVCVQCASL